ncbi:MAG: carboxypeptidase-like regulatory domain-containing protein [Bacteroidales bacterium]
MKTLVFTIAVFLTVHLSVYAQISPLSGMISDSLTGKPVENVNLQIIGTSYGAATDSSGYFTLDFPELPARVKVSHVHYKSKTIHVRNWRDLRRVQLTPYIYRLDEAVVKPAVSISDGLWLDIIDYAHLGDSILLSGYCYHYSAARNPWIYLISPSGDTLIQKVAGAEGRFFEDCMGNMHYLTENTDFQIFIDRDSIHFTHPEHIRDFEEYLQPCLFETASEMIFQRYEINDQMISYHAVNKETHEWRPVYKVQDEHALNMLAFQDRFFAMGPEPSEADYRFEKMCFYDSIYSPLFYLRDSIYLFSFYENEILVMDDDFDIIRQVTVDIHHNKDFQEMLIPDYALGDMYGLFERNGYSYIRQIGLDQGKAKKSWRIPGFKWVDKITIRQGILYFLYREKFTGDLVSLYRMKLKD